MGQGPFGSLLPPSLVAGSALRDGLGMRALPLALLHFHPRVGELELNRRRLLAAVHQAAEAGARWILTPELCLSGYRFLEAMGAEWIAPQPDAWMADLLVTVRRLGVTLFLGHAEHDPETDQRYNTLFVLGPQGVLGRHRKIHVIPGAEAWATKGDRLDPVAVDGISVGLLVCADAYTAPLVEKLKVACAEMLVSAAAWSPMPHGPEGAWEARSLETGLPLFVCNRTGMDATLDFSAAESGVYWRGVKQFGYAGPEAVLRMDWDPVEGIRAPRVIPGIDAPESGSPSTAGALRIR